MNSSSSTDDSLDNSPDVDDEDDDQAHSFRKRRLTLTKHHLQNAACAGTAAVLAADHDHDSDEADSSSDENKVAVGGKRKQHESSSSAIPGIQCSPPPPSKRIKRAGIIQASSSTTTQPLDDSLRKRILHAGEITRKHIIIPAGAAATAATHHNHQTQTKWRKRFSFTSNTGTHNTSLPFPLHIVGSYSCHGMEPVYDSDYSHSSSSSSTDNNNDSTIVAKINQDRGGIAYPYCQSTHCALFGVYDGHGEGGEKVSQYALIEVQRLLEERLLRGGSFSSDEELCWIKKAFRDTFLEVDRGLLNESDIEVRYIQLYRVIYVCLHLLASCITLTFVTSFT